VRIAAITARTASPPGCENREVERQILARVTPLSKAVPRQLGRPNCRPPPTGGPARAGCPRPEARPPHAFKLVLDDAGHAIDSPPPRGRRAFLPDQTPSHETASGSSAVAPVFPDPGGRGLAPNALCAPRISSALRFCRQTPDNSRGTRGRWSRSAPPPLRDLTLPPFPWRPHGTRATQRRARPCHEQHQHESCEPAASSFAAEAPHAPHRAEA